MLSIPHVRDPSRQADHRSSPLAAFPAAVREPRSLLHCRIESTAVTGNARSRQASLARRGRADAATCPALHSKHTCLMRARPAARAPSTWTCHTLTLARCSIATAAPCTGWQQPPPRFPVSDRSDGCAVRRTSVSKRVWITVSSTQYLAHDDGSNADLRCPARQRIEHTKRMKRQWSRPGFMRARARPRAPPASRPCGRALSAQAAAQTDSLLWLCEIARDLERPCDRPPPQRGSLSLSQLAHSAQEESKHVSSLAELLSESPLSSASPVRPRQRPRFSEPDASPRPHSDSAATCRPRGGATRPHAQLSGHPAALGCGQKATAAMLTHRCAEASAPSTLPAPERRVSWREKDAVCALTDLRMRCRQTSSSVATA